MYHDLGITKFAYSSLTSRPTRGYASLRKFRICLKHVEVIQELLSKSIATIFNVNLLINLYIYSKKKYAHLCSDVSLVSLIWFYHEITNEWSYHWAKVAMLCLCQILYQVIQAVTFFIPKRWRSPTTFEGVRRTHHPKKVTKNHQVPVVSCCRFSFAILLCNTTMINMCTFPPTSSFACESETPTYCKVLHTMYEQGVIEYKIVPLSYSNSAQLRKYLIRFLTQWGHKDQ